ncbi:MAG: cytosine permease [Candidatus Thermoplasmatota archaeon]|jgi:NCS1 family nucleobase:cation symporter-1|nr:cytosine permease [Candidatus Thermoplasmatota archaeon]MCL5790689.1 cytosine permease [Candidatus Thermoplasmatota archaeon]
MRKDEIFPYWGSCLYRHVVIFKAGSDYILDVITECMINPVPEGIGDDTMTQSVEPSQRTVNPKALFYLWFGSNLTVADFVLGVLVESFGLSFYYTIFSLLIANLFGGALVGIMAYLGPESGKGQMDISKGIFGESGGRGFSGLQFLNTIGWLTVNLIISARALRFMITGGAAISPSEAYILEGLTLAATMAVIIITVIYGHKSIKLFEKAMSVVLGILFLVIIVFILRSGINVAPYEAYPFSIINFTAIFMLAFSYIMSWGPYASDYSRYVKIGALNPRRAAIWTMAGVTIASFGVEMIGYLFAISLDLNGVFSNSMFVSSLGIFWILGSITIFLGGVAANSINLYSNMMSVRSLGFRAGRKIIVPGIAVTAIILGAVFFNTFSDYFEGFLYVLDYWITPWLGVMIAEYFFVRRKEFLAGRINWSPVMAYLLGIAVSIPFMDTIQYYFGIPIPLYGITGGSDISYFISFVAAFMFTLILEKYLRIYPVNTASSNEDKGSI